MSPVSWHILCVSLQDMPCEIQLQHYLQRQQVLPQGWTLPVPGTWLVPGTWKAASGVALRLTHRHTASQSCQSGRRQTVAAAAPAVEAAVAAAEGRLPVWLTLAAAEAQLPVHSEWEC